MLKDWIGSFALSLTLFLEVLSLALALKTYLFRRLKVSFGLVYGLAAVLLAQVYFLLSLAPTSGLSPSKLHGAIAFGLLSGLGIYSWRMHRAQEPHLHFKLARYLSPMSWRRAWPWLALPLAWTLIRTIDALVPSNHPSPLSIHLLAPRIWIETGQQRLDPLNPLQSIASVWEGLYYHLLGLSMTVGVAQRGILARAQIASQLSHFALGQLLSIHILANFIAPFVRRRWDKLVHSTLSPAFRHRVGMANAVTSPSSVFFAWIASAGLSSGLSGSIAKNEWGANMALFSAIGFLATPGALAQNAAFFLYGSALAMNPGAGFAGVGLLVVSLSKELSFSKIARHLAFAALGCLTWILRNKLHAGVFFYPPHLFAKAASAELVATPGWFPRELAVELSFVGFSVFALKAAAVVLAGSLAYRKLRKTDLATWDLTAFTLASALALSAIHGLRLDFPYEASASYLAVLAALLGVLSVEYALTALAQRSSARLSSYIPLAWLFSGLFFVSIPMHLFWQNLSLALTPTDKILSSYHRHFEAKRWASVHLPRNAKIAWTADSENFYLEQPSASILHSSLLSAGLHQQATPSARARALCELGFDVLAWEDQNHGQEVAGLLSWLKLVSPNEFFSPLHATDDVTFLDLSVACAHAR